MKISELSAISPIDGRYRSKVEKLAGYFSEQALIRYRVLVEIEYFIALSSLDLPQLKNLDDVAIQALRRIYDDFDDNEALKVKEIEQETNHDVKAVEYYLREKFTDIGLDNYLEFIHFGLTSQDVNNTSIPYSLKQALDDVILPELHVLCDLIDEKAGEWSDTPMLARTHGQPASPTNMGKEIRVFSERLREQIRQLSELPLGAKFGGATGNFNAHKVAFPNVDWISFANKFIHDSLGLQRQQTTTQIEHYDNLAALFDNFARINNILTDLSRDVWTYISISYFGQKVIKTEVGSSAMPHKVNPIDFENAEGNLGMANALFRHLSGKLPISRLQRDLTDSTAIRNIGVPFAHSLIAYQSLVKGMNKVLINREVIRADLEDNWAVLAEAVQTILRRESYPDPYQALKELTRGKDGLTMESLHHFIDGLDLPEEVKKELRAITPSNYTGYTGGVAG